MIIPISQDINKFFVNINGTNYPVKKMLFNGQGVQNVEVYADYYSQYFTIESLEDGNEVTFDRTQTYYASTDGGLNWTSYSTTNSWTLNTGNKIMFKATQAQSDHKCGYFSSTKQFNVYGNIMSMFYGDDFEGQYVLGARSCARMFAGCTGLVNTEHLMLPATILGSYEAMFSGCTALTKAPQLPATTLVDGCYSNMFNGCTSLVNAPVLPATTLANYCYNSMFKGCTSLVTAPELPATTLAFGCYVYMFENCTSLVNAPVLPAATLASNCYANMFLRCTSLVDAPELPALTLVSGCYSFMFNGCSALKKVVCLATDIGSSNTQYWITSNQAGTFYKNASMSSWPRSVHGIPSNWTVVNW